MAGKQVCFYLKVPSKPPTLLHRLENSLLECLIEYKPIDPGVDLGRIRLFEIQSAYQIRSSVQIIEDELLVQFTARNVGVHTARIFSNTKEICQAVAFFVKSSGDVETIDVKHSTSSLITNKGTDSGLASGTSTTRGVEPTIPFQLPSIPSSSVDHYSPVKQSSHPEPGYPGDLFGRPSGATFDQLLTAKQTGQVIPGIKSSSQPGSLVHKDTSADTMTTEMLHDIKKEAKSSLASFGVKIKKRCDICSHKVKSNKSVTIWETDFCDSCFKRNYMLRSAIEHFMTPSIQECTVQVPLNKRGTKFAKTKKILPNVNLRGLEPVDIRNGMQEFHKFDIEGDGWMDKAVLLPVLKACFTYTLPDKEIRALLSSPSLASMMTTMGLVERDKVHHIEFLALLAFIARERQRLTRDMLPNSKFTHNDLAMAYAFQKQFGSDPSTTMPQRGAVYKPRPPSGSNITRSFTDSPLSHYQPVSIATRPNDPLISPTHSSSPVAPIITGDEQDEENILSSPTGGEFNDTDHEVDEQQQLQKMISHSSLKKKKKEDSMAQLKITGDQRADGWMLY